MKNTLSPSRLYLYNFYAFLIAFPLSATTKQVNQQFKPDRSESKEQKEEKNLEKKWLIAAQKGQLHTAQLLQQQGANINAKDQDGDNALHLACFFSGSVPMVTWLLDVCKIGIEIKGKYQRTPFLCAAEKGQLQITELLKKRGANINAKSKRGNSALHLACLHSGNEAMVKWLLDVCKISIEIKGQYQKPLSFLLQEKDNLT